MIKFLVAVLALTASTAFALPVGIARPIEKMNFKSMDANAFDFEGIIKLSNCSASLIKFEGASEDKKAVVMTNGHCADLPGGVFIEPGEVIVNRPVKRGMGLYNSQMKINRVQSTRFIYATMTDTDISLYELDLTYRQIKDKFDIDPFLLAPAHPVEGTEMQIISGYWDRGWDCSIDAFIPQIKEDAYTWTDSIRYNEACNTTHGTSGAPIIERNTRTIIGINNTGNDSGERCTMDNPCEVSTDGTITVREGISYGQQTYQIYTCLNKNFDLDLKKPGCKLPKPQK